jgi:predicted transcriptional regulator
MSQQYEELSESYNGNFQNYERLRAVLKVRQEALDKRRSELSVRWKESGPHASEVAARCKEILKPVRAAMTELFDIESARNERMAALSKSLKKRGKTEKKLPVMEELVLTSQWDLEEGLPKRTQILDAYEEAIRSVETFFEEIKVPTVS